MAQIMAAPLSRNFLKIFNLRTTNTMKMKLDTIAYRHETFHLTKDLGGAQRGSEGVAQKPLKKALKLGFLDPFHIIFNYKSKSVMYAILCLALHHLREFCANRT